MTGTEAAAQESKGGTWPLAALAEVRMRGADIPEPGSKDEETILAAWKVYRYVLARARREGNPAIRYASDGYEWTGNLPSVFHDLWPAGTPIIPSQPDLKEQEARGPVITWLCTSQNMGFVTKGRPEMTTRKEGTLGSLPDKWWIADEFRGVPPSMKLPELAEADPDAPIPIAPVSPAQRELNGADWWCPFTNFCGQETPISKHGLSIHLSKMHNLKSGSFLHREAMAQAEELHATGARAPAPDPNASPLDALFNEYEPPPPPPSLPSSPQVKPPRSLIDPSPAPSPSAPPAPQAGSIAAQGRVFASQVAELEEENARLRRDNEFLLDRLYRIEPEEGEIRLSQGEIERIARRLASLLSSRNGDS